MFSIRVIIYFFSFWRIAPAVAVAENLLKAFGDLAITECFPFQSKHKVPRPVSCSLQFRQLMTLYVTEIIEALP